MKKILFILFSLVWLAACSSPEEGISDTSREPLKQETKENKEEGNQIYPNSNEQTETPSLTEEKAVDIAKKLMGEFNHIMTEMGEENGWNFENPAEYEIAKPKLLRVATEEFADHHLKEYVESYYCSCDSIWFPRFDDQTVRIETELNEKSFSVKGLVLPNYVSGGYEITLEVASEDGDWKMAGWNSEYFIGKDMNFTKEEIQIAHPDKEIKEEQFHEQYGISIYRAESEYEVVGISKKDGTLYGIE